MTTVGKVLAASILVFGVLATSGRADAASVTIRPGAYAGSYFVEGVSSYVSGEQTLNVAPGSYRLWIDPNGGGSLYFVVDPAGNVSLPNTDAATVTGNVVSFRTVDVGIDPADYTGGYSIAGRPTAWAPTVVSLVRGMFFTITVCGATNDGFRIQVLADGSVALPTPSAATLSPSGVVTFQTVGVKVDPGAYTGIWALAGSGWVTGPCVVRVVPGGILYWVSPGEYGGARVRVEADGTLTSLNTAALGTADGGRTLVFKNSTIRIDPQGYSGAWAMDAVSGIRTGAADVVVVPGGIQYHVQVSLTRQIDPGFRVQVNLDGSVTSYNTIAAQGVGSRLVFANVPVRVNPTTYDAGPYELALITRTGVTDLVLVPGLSWTIDAWLGFGTFQLDALRATPQSFEIVGLDGVAHPFLVSVGVPANGPPVELGPPTDVAVDISPRLVSGDFDRDGLTDVAVCNAGSNTLQILRNTGRGTLEIVQTLTTGPSSFLAVGDVDGDGDLDIVVTGGNAQYMVFLNLAASGGHGFEAQGHGGGVNLDGIIGVAVADVDRDRTLDLIIDGYSPSRLAVLHGNGDGTFDYPGAHYYDVGAGPCLLAAGDLNGDDVPDVAVTSQNTNSITIYLSAPATGGTIGPLGSRIVVPTGRGPAGVLLEDVNGDGRRDMVTADYGGNTVSVHLRHGDGTFGPYVSYPVGAVPVGLAVGDVNGDGALDIVVGGSATAVLLGDGLGGFRAAQLFPIGYALSHVAVFDVTGDGKPDIVATSFSSVVIFPNRTGAARDVTPPTLALPADLVVEQASAAGSIVAFTLTATDDKDPAPQVGSSPATGATFPVGVTTVACWGQDASGNRAEGTFQVTVHDTTPPALTVPASLEITALPGTPILATDPEVQAWLALARAQDTADPAPTLANDASVFPVGATTTVHFVVRDASGNQTTGSATLAVVALDVAILAPASGLTTRDPVTVAYATTGRASSVVLTATRTVGATTLPAGLGPTFAGEGSYVATVTATCPRGSVARSVAFAIDRSPPVVTIASPLPVAHPAAAYPRNAYVVAIRRPAKHDDRDDRDDHHGRGSEAEDRRDGVVSAPGDLPITLAVKATDAGVGVRTTSTFLDGRALDLGTGEIALSTFFRLGVPVLGRHVVEVRAADLAGNEVRAVVAFEVVLGAPAGSGLLEVRSGEGDERGGASGRIAVTFELPILPGLTPLDPSSARDVLLDTLRLECEAGRRAKPVKVELARDGRRIEATFRVNDLVGAERRLGEPFVLTGRFFSSTGPSFFAVSGK